MNVRWGILGELWTLSDERELDLIAAGIAFYGFLALFPSAAAVIAMAIQFPLVRWAGKGLFLRLGKPNGKAGKVWEKLALLEANGMKGSDVLLPCVLEESAGLLSL